MAEIGVDSSGEGLRVGIVRSRFNERIGVAMLEACRKRLAELHVTALTVVSVPGALEAPFALQKLAKDKGVSPAQLAIAWVFAKGQNIVPASIP